MSLSVVKKTDALSAVKVAGLDYCFLGAVTKQGSYAVFVVETCTVAFGFLSRTG